MNQEFLKATYGKKANELLLKGIDSFLLKTKIKTKLRALELGCGSGNDVKLLLEKGFIVDAVDKNPSVEAYLAKHEHLTFYNTSFEKFVPVKKYDLINAQWSVSFCNPANFPQFWQNLVNAMNPGGLFIGNFFGFRDEWSTDSDKTFFTLNQLQGIFSSFSIVSLEEKEYDGRLAVGDKKHWHLFEVIAVKSKSN